MEENPYAAPREVAEIPAAAPSEAETVRYSYLKHEASLKSVGSVYFIISVFMVFGAVTSAFAILRSSDPGALPRVSGIVGAVGILGFVVAFGLRMLKPWARIVAIVLSGLAVVVSIFNMPSGFIGIVIHAYILSILASPKSSLVLSPYYQEIIAATPHIKYRTSKIVWILLGLLLLIILMTFGYVYLSTR